MHFAPRMGSAVERRMRKSNLTVYAYTLLNRWSCLSGDAKVVRSTRGLSSWITEMRRFTEESGHDEIAQVEVGRY